jgi:putative ABC transport system permease protein
VIVLHPALRGGLFAMASLVIALLPFLALPFAYAVLASVLLMILIFLVDASRNRVLLRMATRNAARRRGTTALVIGGLMVGTAIISASLVVGDTFSNMIDGEITKGAGQVDFVVGSVDSAGMHYLSYSNWTRAQGLMMSADYVTAVSTMSMGAMSVINPDTGLFTTSADVLGCNGTLFAPFGGFVAENGTAIGNGPSAFGAYVYQKLAVDIGASVGSSIVLSIGNASLPLRVEAIVRDHEPGASGLSPSVFVDISTLSIFTAKGTQRNVFYLAIMAEPNDPYAHSAQVRQELNDLFSGPLKGDGLKVLYDTGHTLEQGRKGVQMFLSIFLVFGSFSIIAGIALVVNIFTMLGEERKSEMGMARAIGMNRSSLRRVFTYEGVIYAAVAAAIGALVGLLLAYLIVLGIAQVFSFGETPITDYFTFTSLSLTAAYMAGFMLTIATVYLATVRISKMNIVRAIRNIPDPPISRGDGRVRRTGLAVLACGLAVTVLGTSAKNQGMALSGLSLIAISMGFLLRKVLGDRISWNLAAVATLLIWLPKPDDWQIFPYGGDIEMFVVAGLFMVTSALLVIMFNSDAIVKALTSLLRFRSGYRAVLMTSVSYPLKAKVRTGLSIFIFGLVVFTVTALSVMSGILNYNIPIQVSEASGGFDTIGVKLSTVPLTQDPWEMVNASGVFLEPDNVTMMLSLPASPVRLSADFEDPVTHNMTNKQKSYNIVGFESSLYSVGDFPLASWNSTTYHSQVDVWQAVLGNPSLVIVDGGLAGGQGNFMGQGSSFAVKVGQWMQVQSRDGIWHNVTVAGIMKQAYFNGVFVSNATARAQYGADGYSILLVNFRQGLNVDQQATLLEREFLSYSVTTISVKSLAQELVRTIDGIFNLLKGFLALGLVIGIVGLGIMTIRSIHERRLEIGMMRALGYTRRMVVVNFAIESAFVSALGIVIGAILGVIIGYQIHLMAFQSMGYAFVIDWFPIIAVCLLAFLATVLCVFPAARGASRVSPAEVLRFE